MSLDRRAARPRGEPDLVGREAELTTLAHLLDEARSGSSRSVVIEGEPGIGKTRLAREIAQRATAAGFTNLQGWGEELHMDRPFGVVAAALGVEGASADPARRRIGELLRESPDPGAVSVDHRYRIVVAIEDAFEREAIRGPVVVVVEDVHWADPSSIHTFHVLSRRSDLPILLLLTCRPTPRSEELRRFLDGAIESGGQLLRLDPLDDEGVAELATSRLGAAPGPVLRGQLARTAGNPLFVLELLDGLEEEHMIEHLEGAAETSQEVEPPPSLRTVIIRRLGFMSRPTIELLRTASLLGESFSATDLAAVTGRPLAEVLDTLQEPVAAGFVSATEEAFAFRHDVVREALYGDVPAAMRKGLHLHIGRTLAAAGAPPTTVAPHIALGAEPGDREAVRWLQDAAADIAPRAPGVAADLLHRAGELLPADDPELVTLGMQEVRDLAVAARLDEAGAVAEALAPRVKGTPLQMMLDLERTNLFVLQARIGDAGAFVGSILEDPTTDEAFREWARVFVAGTRVALGDVRGGLAQIEAARPFVTANPSSMAAAMCSLLDGVILWMRARFGNAVGFFEHAASSWEFFTGGSGQALPLLGTALGLADRFEEARETLEAARTDLERRGMVAYLVEHHWFLAHVHFVSGQWDDALAEIAASRQLAAETGIAGIGSTVPDPTPLVQLFRGDVAGAREAFAAAEREPTVGAGGPLGIWWDDPIRAVLEDASGDRDAALATLRTRDRSLTELAFIPDFRSIGRTVVRMCRAADADDLLQNMLAGATEAYARADGVRSVEGAALLVQGMVAGDSDRLLAAVEALRVSGRPFDLAEACAEAALALFERGERDRGQQLAAGAFQAYEVLGARRQEALLAQDLREYGIRRGARRRRARAAGGWEALTVSERRVVALVSEGLTNGEIGARLFISKGTVATHLRSVFRKLEVSSRAGLAAEAARHLA